MGLLGCSDLIQLDCSVSYTIPTTTVFLPLQGHAQTAVTPNIPLETNTSTTSTPIPIPLHSQKNKCHTHHTSDCWAHQQNEPGHLLGNLATPMCRGAGVHYSSRHQCFLFLPLPKGLFTSPLFQPFFPLYADFPGVTPEHIPLFPLLPGLFIFGSCDIPLSLVCSTFHFIIICFSTSFKYLPSHSPEE